ncbi:MAG TPA: cytidylate kinase-like family protein [Solirubrobacteraceae bacterium]
MTVVTLSASYGAGGSQIGPRLAERLGLEFIDRAIPTTVAARLAVPVDDALAHDEAAVRGVLERLLLRFAPAAQTFAGATPAPELVDERSYLRCTEDVIREAAARGAVILGRAGAIVLADAPDALHVRLDGPRERRLAQAMALEGVDRETAERHLRETDRARLAYVEQFYGSDQRDPALYHLVIDSTVFALDATVELIAVAAAARADPAS